MDDSIEVCSRCGKMPRAIDLANGSFICSRCSNSQLIAVKGDDYEKIVTELDRNFKSTTAAKRLEEAKELPPEPMFKKKKTVKPKTVQKASAKTAKKKVTKKR